MEEQTEMIALPTESSRDRDRRQKTSLEEFLGDLFAIVIYSKTPLPLNMTWRRLLPNPSLHCIRNEHLNSICRVFLRPKLYCSTRLQHFKGKGEAGTGFSGVLINPRAVQSTLANCPSDLFALSFFLWCARQRNYFHDRNAFAHMVDIVARLIERFKSVSGVVRELERIGCSVKAQTFLLLIRIFWNGGLYPSMFCAWDTMVKFGYKPNTFARNAVMDVYFKICSPDFALRTLDENHAPNFLSFNIALGHLCKLNDLLNVEDVMRKMLRAGYYPNEETLVMALNCFSKKGRLAEAFQVLGLMHALGFQASLPVWNILIDGFCKIGEPGRAGYLLEKMIDTGCSPNVMTLTCLFKGFIRLQMVHEASQVLTKMESRGCEIDLFHCNVLIDCFSKTGMHREAIATFFNLIKRKFEPDSYTFSSILSCISSCRKYDKVLKVMDGFPAPAADLVLCNSRLTYYCKAGLPTRALDYGIVDMPFAPDKYSYMGLLDGLCRSGKFNVAINLVRGMARDGVGLDAHCPTLIISRLFGARKYHEACDFFKEAVSKEYVLDAISYRIVIHALVRGSMIREAFTVYCQMKSVGMVPDTFTHNIMLYRFCRTGDLDTVKMLLEQMLDEKVELDIRNFTKVCDIICSRQCDVLFHILIEMRDLELVPERAMHILLLKGHFGLLNLIRASAHPLLPASVSSS